jgi:hypothetical protein
MSAPYNNLLPSVYNGSDLTPDAVPTTLVGSASDALGSAAGSSGGPPSTSGVPTGVGSSASVPLIPSRIMHLIGALDQGSFGSIDLVRIRGVVYAAKRTSLHSADGGALARELVVYNRVHGHPHPHIMPLNGVCTDHEDGHVRLVMRKAVCSMEGLLKKVRVEVGVLCSNKHTCLVLSCS